MRCSIVAEGTVFEFRFTNSSDHILIHDPDSFVLHLYKYSSHSYSFRLFFYSTLRIISMDGYRSIKELLDVVQKYLDLTLSA